MSFNRALKQIIMNSFKDIFLHDLGCLFFCSIVKQCGQCLIELFDVFTLWKGFDSEYASQFVIVIESYAGFRDQCLV